MDSSNPETHFLIFTIIFLLCVAAYLLSMLIAKIVTIEKMKESHQRLMRSFNELDEQAKLIVRTDLELNKTRDEMDKRLNGLNALQRTSRHMSQALNETEIFQKIPVSLFEELGFTRVLIASINDINILKVRLNLGYKDSRVENILKEVEAEESLKKATHSLSSIHSPTKIREKIVYIFESEHFIFSPILTQTGTIGFVFAGNRYNAPAVTQGDEELITILAGQIGQSIENAKLFEKVFLSSQELELKVAQRTQQLANALQKVNDISKKKSEFISAVSHELRTPLTSIKGYAAILIAGKIGELPAPVKERLTKINYHSDNLVGLINNLLDIARIESGRQEMKLAVYKIKNVLDNVNDLLLPQMNTKSIKLLLHPAQNIEEIFVDASQVERVFINLLSNAIKFTPTNGSISISVFPVLSDGYVTFKVTDTGIGIPEGELQKLFTEFFRVDNEINQSVKGTGLGLVLAKNIVEAHHGKMWVESKVSEGTSFFFTLPSSEKSLRDRLNIEKTYAS